MIGVEKSFVFNKKSVRLNGNVSSPAASDGPSEEVKEDFSLVRTLFMWTFGQVLGSSGEVPLFKSKIAPSSEGNVGSLLLLTMSEDGILRLLQIGGALCVNQLSREKKGVFVIKARSAHHRFDCHSRR